MRSQESEVRRQERIKRCNQAQAERRAYSSEPGLLGRARSERVDLGLAILSCHALPGVCYSYQEIALWCGVTDGAIVAIAQRALRKIRKRLLFTSKDEGRDLAAEFFDRRSPARKAVGA
jgi:hypothetical protein